MLFFAPFFFTKGEKCAFSASSTCIFARFLPKPSVILSICCFVKKISHYLTLRFLLF